MSVLGEGGAGAGAERGLCAQGAQPLPAALEQRLAAVHDELLRLERVLVAFSGGVDSSLLLALAQRALGRSAAGVIAVSPSLAARELEDARHTASAIGARLIEVSTDELSDPAYAANDATRCYHCKRTLFLAMQRLGREMKVEHLVFGEIVDDLAEDRPGARAAREFSVHAPLCEAGMTKEDVRRAAHALGLGAADKPSAPCLASRLPRGTRVTRERLARVEAAEAALHDLGWRQLRVRDHAPKARVEIGAEEFERARAQQDEIARCMRAAGFEHTEVALYAPPARLFAAPGARGR